MEARLATSAQSSTSLICLVDDYDDYDENSIMLDQIVFCRSLQAVNCQRSSFPSRRCASVEQATWQCYVGQFTVDLLEAAEVDCSSSHSQTLFRDII